MLLSNRDLSFYRLNCLFFWLIKYACIKNVYSVWRLFRRIKSNFMGDSRRKITRKIERVSDESLSKPMTLPSVVVYFRVKKAIQFTYQSSSVFCLLIALNHKKKEKIELNDFSFHMSGGYLNCLHGCSLSHEMLLPLTNRCAIFQCHGFV